MNAKRGRSFSCAHVKEKVVARNRETKKVVSKTTAVPAGFSQSSRRSAIRRPRKPPAGMCDLKRGIPGIADREADTVSVKSVVPKARDAKASTLREVSQWN